VFEGLLGNVWFCVATKTVVPAGLEKVKSAVLGLTIFSYLKGKTVFFYRSTAQNWNSAQIGRFES
jgi:hypothetical protein